MKSMRYRVFTDSTWAFFVRNSEE